MLIRAAIAAFYLFYGLSGIALPALEPASYPDATAAARPSWIGTPWIGRKVLGPVQVSEGLQYTDVQLFTQDLALPAYWLDDGKRIALIDKAGIVTVLSVPDFTVLQRGAVGRPVLYVCQIRSGFVAGDFSAGATLIDLSKPDIIRTQPLAKGDSTAVGSMVFGSPQSNRVLTVSQNSLNEFDPGSGKFIRAIPIKFLLGDPSRLSVQEKEQYAKVIRHPAAKNSSLDIGASAGGFASDGKTLVLKTPDGPLVRIEIGTTQATVKEVSAPLGGQVLPMSLDRQYLATPSAGPYDGHPTVESGSVFIYKTFDLQKPIAVIVKPAGTAIGFDGVRHRYYSAGSDRFESWTAKGDLEKAWTIPGLGRTARLILVHPSGGMALVFTELRCVWMALP